MAQLKDLSNINAFKDFTNTFRGKSKETTVFMIANVLLSSMLTGLLYEYYEHFMGKRRTVVIISSFKYGITKCFILTLILTAFFFFLYFRFLRMMNLGKKDYENGVERSQNKTFGDAHFQDEDERKKHLHRVNTIADTTEDIIGIDATNKYCSLIWPPGMPRNKLLIGAPGSGKTSFVIKMDTYQTIRRRESIVLTDSKGDVYSETVAVAREQGYIVKVLNIKDKELQNSNGFNVMEYLDPNSITFAAECSSIANIIITNTQGDDPMDYWAKNETMALSMIIMELASGESYRQMGQNNLYGVYEFLSTKSSDEMKQIFTRHPQGSPIRMAYNNFAKASAQNQGQILNGLADRLWMLNNPVFGKVLRYNEIDFTLPMKKPCIYYVIIPDNDDTYKFIAALFFGMMFKYQCEYSDSLIKEEKKRQLPVYYLLDEYKNIGGVYQLNKKISTVRSRKIYITIILQSNGQLDQIHGEDGANEIRNACVVKGLLSTNDMDTAIYFSKLLGDFTAKTQNERYDEDKADVAHMHGHVNIGTGEQRVPLRAPADLMNENMDRNEVIYVVSNMWPLLLKKAFAELDGVPYHFMEARGIELGHKKSFNYRPHWRKVEEEQGIYTVNCVPVRPERHKGTSTEDASMEGFMKALDNAIGEAVKDIESRPSEKSQAPSVKLIETSSADEKSAEEKKETPNTETEKKKERINKLLNVFDD